MKRMKFRRELRLLAWLEFAFGSIMATCGIIRLIVMREHWSFGLLIIGGILFIIAGVYFWKATKNAY